MKSFHENFYSISKIFTTVLIASQLSICYNRTCIIDKKAGCDFLI